MKEYYKQLYAHKLRSLDEMDKLFKRCRLSTRTQEEIENLSKTMASTD